MSLPDQGSGEETADAEPVKDGEWVPVALTVAGSGPALPRSRPMSPDAEAVLLPDTVLHKVAYLPAPEKDLGKPVLTADQVTVWEAPRLADRRVNAPSPGTLFTREPLTRA